jgi:OPA family glycerol-3-phosphate transporter-like MFS transporter
MSTTPAAFADPAFRRRRTLNWLVLGLLYSFFYMTRYNFAATMSELAKTFGWTNLELGTFETMMPLVYGISVVLNGPIADRVGGRRAFLFGAVGVTLMNFAFGACLLAVATPAVMAGTGHDAHVVTAAVLRGGFSASGLRNLMVLVWGINGYFQSFGALSIVKVNAHWFHVRERGTFAGVFGVLIRLGLILAFSGVPFILTLLPLPWAFWLPGAFVAVMFVANLAWMRDRPADAGFGDMDTGEGDADDGKPARVRDVLAKVFGRTTTWLIALASMMIGMVRRSTVDSWYPKFFRETYMSGRGELAHFGPYQGAVWGIAVLGIVGGFTFGGTSDRVFGGRRAPVITVGFVGMAVTLGLLGLSVRLGFGPWIPAACLALLSFFVNGAHGMVGGAASMDFGGRKAAATAAGLFDGMQYLASSFVGLGMGWVLDRGGGWTSWPWVPIPFAIVGAVVIANLWNVKPGSRSHG